MAYGVFDKLWRIFKATILFFILTNLCFALDSFAQAHQRINPDGTYRQVNSKQSMGLRTVLERYLDGEFGDDIASFKLAIDNIVTEEAKAATVLQSIDQMVADIEAMAEPNANEADLLNAMRTYVYDAGDWNNGKIFSYDHSDPLGTKIENKLLATYLTTRRGNCISMPTLILILGRRLGMDMTFATAPSHVFVKYRPRGSSVWINLETTSGANPARNSWIRQGFPMTDLSIESGLYMRELSEDQLAANIAVTVLEDAYGDGRWWDTILIAEAIRKLDSQNLSAILLRWTAPR